MIKNILTHEAILERDIDLLIIEELCTDDDFCSWFVKEFNLPEFTKGEGALHSITDSGLGETDILFKYQSKDSNILVFIENKINASFQDEQFTRYQKRASKALKQKDCDLAFVVLIAPKDYCVNQFEFENYLTYESIAEKLVATGSKRGQFRSSLLMHAALKLSRGYQPVNSNIVQSFWKAYWKYKEEHFPTLIMKEPGIVPDNSDWPMLFDRNLKNITFYHKLAQGNVDANFRNTDPTLKKRISEMLPKHMRIETHNKSFSIRIFTGEINRKQSFDEQLKAVQNGLETMSELRDWIKAELKDYLSQA